MDQGKPRLLSPHLIQSDPSLADPQTPEEIAAAGGKSRIIKLAVDGYALLYHRERPMPCPIFSLDPRSCVASLARIKLLRDL
jgi:hypothetical protein